MQVWAVVTNSAGIKLAIILGKWEDALCKIKRKVHARED
jgi:hypothetical protein